MAFTLNRIELIGRLGRDPEMRYTPEGQAITTFSLATDRRTRGGTETDWHRIVCWDKLAEVAGDYLTSGRLVFVAGRLIYREWEDREGTRRRAAEVVVSELILLDRRPEAAPRAADADPDESVPF
jgi:single-strand DNA-binding protein